MCATKVLHRRESLAIMETTIKDAQQRHDVVTVLQLQLYLGSYKYFHLGQEDGLATSLAALRECEKRGWMKDWSGGMHDLGMSFYHQNNHAKSLEFQLRAFPVFKKNEGGMTYVMAIVSLDLANLYYHLGNYNASLELLLPVVAQLKLPADVHQNNRPHFLYMQALNTIGLCYRELQKNDSAIIWWKRTSEVAVSAFNPSWEGIAAGNIGTVLIKQHKYEEALPYVKLFYNSVVNKDPKTTAEALISWSEINIAGKRTSEALAQLARADSLLFKNPGYYSAGLHKMRKHIYELYTRVYLYNNDFPKAFRYASMADSLNEVLQLQYNSAQYSNVEVQLEAEKNLAEIRQVEAATKLSIQSRNFSLVALALGGLFVFTLYNRQRLKNRKDRELHQSRKQLLHVEKKRAEEQLAGYMENLHEKNRIIEEFETEKDKVQLQSDSIDKLQTLETVEKLKRSTIITEDEWIQFRSLFDKVHKGFFTRLKVQYPDVTQAEIRLMALTKLNLSTKEMAGILGISPESIRKSRYRFLKKVSDISGEADFAGIVSSI
jgi:hypothetical protein